MDRALWVTWYDLPAAGCDAYLSWLHGVYIPRLLERPDLLWAAHYATDRQFYKGAISAGQGTNMHLCMEMFHAMAGVDLFHVPYKGTTPALNDLIGGQVQAICASAPTLQPFVKGGRLRTLGVTTRVRTVLAPDLPPIAETVPGFELVGWYGLLAPLGTPKEIVSRISTAVVKALKTPEARERLVAQGAEVAGYGPAEFGDFLRKETVRWGKVLRDANIRATE